jgi:hypothetical protein
MLRLTRTENGMVRGLPATDPRITVYKGIPFAAPNGIDADGAPMPKWTPYTLKSLLVMEFLDKPAMEKEQSKLKMLLLEYNKTLLV